MINEVYDGNEKARVKTKFVFLFQVNHGKEILNANRSIIVLPKSPLPTTSYIIKHLHSSGTSSPRPDQHLNLNSNDTSSTTCTMSTSKQSSSKPLSAPQSPEPKQCEIRISNVQSIGKTSVIRLASPKKPSSIPETNIRPLLKTPFSKQPKKIVVKFKKPFVPVVEEDANLQPPEKVNLSPVDTPVKPVDGGHSEQTTSKSYEHADQSNHPFSPLRQTFTPPPPIYSLISKSRDGDTNADDGAASIVDLCKKESIVQVMTDEGVESDDGDSNKTPITEKQPNDDEMVVDDSVVDAHKCDRKVFKIELKDDDVPDTIEEDVKNVVLQIKIASWSQVSPKQYESILPDSKDAVVLPESSSTDLSLTSTSSQPTTSSQTQNNFNEAGPSRIDYGLSSFEDFYSSVRLSPISFTPENYAWNQRFSPQYVPFDNEKNSYMDLDVYKNANSYEERAPSTDSLNIRTDEKMPAKGEISEQESNGDVEGSSWSHQVIIASALPPRMQIFISFYILSRHRCIRYKIRFHDIPVLMIRL